MNYRKLSLNKMFITMMTGLSVMFSVTSCDKNDSTELVGNEDPKVDTQVMATTTTSGSTLFQSTFETSTDLSQWYLESPTPSSITRTTSPAKYGSYAAKIVLNKTDPDIWESKRAEMTYVAEKHGPVKSERWYGMSIFLPTSYIADPCEEILFQWKGVNKVSQDGYSMSNPPLAMLTKNGRWQLNIKPKDKFTNIDLGTYEPNKWTDWVFHIKWSYEDDGLLQIWKNGVLVLDRKGPNTYYDLVGNFFKMGIYKYGWKEGYYSNTTQRTAYFDEFKVGNENSSFNDVAPRPKTTAPDAEAETVITAPSTTTPTTTTPSVVFAVNAGGSAFTASNGITYQADKNYSGGQVYKTSHAIANTTDDALYQSERFGNAGYSIPVANGTYEITFKFAEIYQTRSGKRQFDVLVEGSQVIQNLDIFKVAGHDKAYDVVKTVTVSDGTLNLNLKADINNAKISAFHVIKK